MITKRQISLIFAQFLQSIRHYILSADSVISLPAFYQQNLHSTLSSSVEIWLFWVHIDIISIKTISWDTWLDIKTRTCSRARIRRAWVISRYQLWVVLRSRIPWFKMATGGQHPPALENAVPRKARFTAVVRWRRRADLFNENWFVKLRPWTTLAHVSFDLGPRLRRGTKNRSLVLSRRELLRMYAMSQILYERLEDHDFILNVALVKLRIHTFGCRNNYD